MATLRTKDIAASLLKKGFQSKNSDHRRFILYVEGKRTEISTKISFGARDIGDYLINRMSIELKLEKDEFKDLVLCPLTKEKYIQLLLQRGLKL